MSLGLENHFFDKDHVIVKGKYKRYFFRRFVFDVLNTEKRFLLYETVPESVLGKTSTSDP